MSRDKDQVPTIIDLSGLLAAAAAAAAAMTGGGRVFAGQRNELISQAASSESHPEPGIGDMPHPGSEIFDDACDEIMMLCDSEWQNRRTIAR